MITSCPFCGSGLEETTRPKSDGDGNHYLVIYCLERCGYWSCDWVVHKPRKGVTRIFPTWSHARRESHAVAQRERRERERADS